MAGLWDFAWWVYQEVNFSSRITQITLIFLFFRVNSRYSRLILARPCEIPKSQDGYKNLTIIIPYLAGVKAIGKKYLAQQSHVPRKLVPGDGELLGITRRATHGQS